MSQVQLVHSARQPIVHASHLAASHSVRAAIRLALQAEQNVLEGAVVHFVLVQQFGFAHRVRFVLQLVNDSLLFLGEMWLVIGEEK